MLAQLNWRRVYGARHKRAAPGAVHTVLRRVGRIARDLEQDMKMLAGGLWHRPGAVGADRADARHRPDAGRPGPLAGRAGGGASAMTARENLAGEPMARAAAQRPDQAGPRDRQPGPGHLYRTGPLGRRCRDRGQPGLPAAAAAG
jgi:hypothetical protein